MNYTPNYQLSQWEPGDQVLRADFNADNAKLDAALGALAGRIEYGTYVGTGGRSESWSGATTLRLGYQPKLLIVGGGNNAGVFVNPATETRTLGFDDRNYLYVQWLEDGVQWHVMNVSTHQPFIQLNAKDVTYHYIAFR